MVQILHRTVVRGTNYNLKKNVPIASSQ